MAGEHAVPLAPAASSSRAPGCTGAARHQIAANLRRRLAPEAGSRLRLFTCMPLSEAGLESAGVEVQPNTYAWLKGQWSDPDVRDGVDLVGTSLVESGVVHADRYLAGVGRLIAQQGVTRYFAHRRESADKLALIRARRGRDRPAEPAAGDRGAPRTGQRDPHQLSRPPSSTPCRSSSPTPACRPSCATCPRAGTCPGVDAAAEAFLRRVTTSAVGSHQLVAVGC